MSTDIGQILPSRARAAETRGETPAAEPRPSEAKAVASSTPQRRREFASSRACAHAALEQLGCADAPIGKAPGGSPHWPDGVVGSITHCSGYRAAAVARTPDIRGLGIDAEPHDPLRDGLMDVIALPGERHHHRWLREIDPGTHWDRILLSAKESVYKAWYPLTGRWLDFADAELELWPHSGAFLIRLDTEPVPELVGRWLVTGDGLVLTSVVVQASSPARHRPTRLT